MFGVPPKREGVRSAPLARVSSGLQLERPVPCASSTGEPDPNNTGRSSSRTANRVVAGIVTGMIALTFVLLGVYLLAGTVGLLRGSVLVCGPLVAVVASWVTLRGIHRMTERGAGYGRWLRRRTGRRRIAHGQATQDRRNHRLRRLKRRAGCDSMKVMTPREFERFVLDYFEALGCRTRGTPPSGDGGIDGYAEIAGETVAIQCKRYSRGNVGEPELRDFLGAITKLDMRGYLVTSGGFTKGAQKFAEGTAVELIDGVELARRIDALPYAPRDTSSS